MRYYVVVSVTNPATGKKIPVSRHDCRDLLQARTLLSEMRDMALDLAEFLPGLTAEGYEAVPVSSPAPSFAEILDDYQTNEINKNLWQAASGWASARLAPAGRGRLTPPLPPEQ